jgi:hypothetical protein
MPAHPGRSASAKPGTSFRRLVPGNPAGEATPGREQSAGYARRRHLMRDCGRGFDSRRLHFSLRPAVHPDPSGGRLAGRPRVTARPSACASPLGRTHTTSAPAGGDGGADQSLDSRGTLALRADVKRGRGSVCAGCAAIRAETCARAPNWAGNCIVAPRHLRSQNRLDRTAGRRVSQGGETGTNRDACHKGSGARGQVAVPEQVGSSAPAHSATAGRGPDELTGSADARHRRTFHPDQAMRPGSGASRLWPPDPAHPGKVRMTWR